MADKPAALVFVYRGDVYVIPPVDQPGPFPVEPLSASHSLHAQILARVNDPTKRNMVGLELAIAYDTRDLGEDDGMEDLP